MDYDIIVLGSGLGGLTCASRLAILGYKVGVFEKHFIPGGYATNFKRKGFNFDVSLHGIGALDEGGNTNSILKNCGVLEKVTPLRNEIAYSVMYKNKLIDIPNDMTAYKDLLCTLFPNETKGIHRLFHAIKKFDNGYNKLIIEPKRNPKHSFFDKLHPDCLTFINWSEKTTDQVIRQYVNNDDFVHIFTTLWPYYGLPPKQLSAIYFFIPWISYHYYGKYYIQGGAQALADAMVEVIKEHGGTVKLRSEVTSMNYKNNQITAITLKNGQQFTAKHFVSNIHPTGTFKLIEGYNIPPQYTSQSIGCSLSQLYLGLDCHPNELNIPIEEVFYFNEYTPEEDYERALKGDYKTCGILLTNYSSMDPTFNDSNKGVITVTLIDNYDLWSTDKNIYKQQKEELTNILIDRLEEKFPGIKEHIVVKELGTPRSMERYTANPKGAVYGYSQTVKQAGRYRLKTDTPIENLFLAGAWVNPGGGYEGSISSGMVVAQQIAKKLKK